MSESFLNGKVTLHRGDCLEVLPLLEANSIDSCVTDPPYHLSSVTKRLGKPDSAPIQFGTDGAYARAAKGFMGRTWDGGDIAFRPETWAEVWRVLKPGAHLLAFSGTRTYHRMACAIEDAGFEIRDQIGWCYGSGFPKSHDVSKGIDRINGAERRVIGKRQFANGTFARDGAVMGQHGVYGSAAGNPLMTAPATPEAEHWQGWGTALKPAWEPIVLARKPISESSIAANVLRWGTGALNINGCRIGTNGGTSKARSEDKCETTSVGGYLNAKAGEAIDAGRWPANLIHDGSEEVLERFPLTKSGDTLTHHKFSESENIAMSGKNYARSPKQDHFGDEGSAARFFYTAKADSDDRLGSKHPTVKPLDLIQYLVRLVTPSRGTVLDPFAGTGTCGEASWREGFHSILIEREPEYQADIVKRMGLCLAGPDERRAKSVKQVGVAGLPMFEGLE